MSFFGDANGAAYAANLPSPLSANQPLYIAGWIKPLTLSGRLGLVYLNIGSGSLVTLCVNAGRVQSQWEGTNQNGPTTLLTLDEWNFIAVYFSGGFNGAAQDIKLYLNGVAGALLTNRTVPDHSSTPFQTVQMGDGVFAETHHRGALTGVWSPANISAADALTLDLLTMHPDNVGGAIAGPWEFVDSVPAGFIAVGAISIDTQDNPPVGPASLNISLNELASESSFPILTLAQEQSLTLNPLSSSSSLPQLTLSFPTTSQAWSDGTFFTDGTGWLEVAIPGLDIFLNPLSSSSALPTFSLSFTPAIRLNPLPSSSFLPTGIFLDQPFPTGGIPSLTGAEGDKQGVELGLGLGL